MPSKSKKQARFMAAVAHGWKPSKVKAPPLSVAKEFNRADKRMKRKNFAIGGLAQAGQMPMSGGPMDPTLRTQIQPGVQPVGGSSSFMPTQARPSLMHTRRPPPLPPGMMFPQPKPQGIPPNEGVGALGSFTGRVQNGFTASRSPTGTNVPGALLSAAGHAQHVQNGVPALIPGSPAPNNLLSTAQDARNRSGNRLNQLRMGLNSMGRGSSPGRMGAPLGMAKGGPIQRIAAHINDREGFGRQGLGNTREEAEADLRRKLVLEDHDFADPQALDDWMKVNDYPMQFYNHVDTNDPDIHHLMAWIRPFYEGGQRMTQHTVDWIDHQVEEYAKKSGRSYDDITEELQRMIQGEKPDYNKAKGGKIEGFGSGANAGMGPVARMIQSAYDAIFEESDEPDLVRAYQILEAVPLSEPLRTRIEQLHGSGDVNEIDPEDWKDLEEGFHALGDQIVRGQNPEE